MSNDISIGLGALALGAVLWALLVDPEWWRFALLPAVPLVIRLAVELPRYWRFEVVLTSRRLILNVGTLRDVYHTLRLAHIKRVRLFESRTGELLGYGQVVVWLDARSPDGKRHVGTYAMDYVRRPRELNDAIVDAVLKVRHDMTEEELTAPPPADEEQELSQDETSGPAVS
jgi:hypothetical protein